MNGPILEGKLLVVDDDEQIRRLLVRLLRSQAHHVETAQSAEEALEKIQAAPPDLVILDVHLPGMSGHAVLERIRDDPRTRLLPVVMLTGSDSRQQKLKAIQSGVTDFLSKPFDGEELSTRVRTLLQLKSYTDALEDAEQVIVALAKTIDARDSYTMNHSRRVSYYAGHLAERIGMRPSAVRLVQRGALFHDIGKIAIRDSVLLKPARLTPEEFEHIKRHTVEGRDLLGHMKSLADALPLVYHHHEKLDGSGYPEGISGDEIPPAVRLISIADVYDALTSTRVYRTAFPPEEAMQILIREARKGWWDAHIIEELRGLLENLGSEELAP